MTAICTEAMAARKLFDLLNTPTPAGGAVAAAARIFFGLLRSIPCGESESECVDRISLWEEGKSLLSGLQTRDTHQFTAYRLAREEAQGVPEYRRGRSIGSEVGLAKRMSPSQGAKDVQAAQTLVEDMPGTLGALLDGQLSETSARTVAHTASSLDRAGRRLIDETLSARYGQVDPSRLQGETRALVAQVDPESAANRHHRAAANRRVWFRPEDDSMATISAYLPLITASACFETLKAQANSLAAQGKAAGRSHNQLTADLFAHHLTTPAGSDAQNSQNSPEGAPKVRAEVLIQITDAALFGVNRYEYQRAKEASRERAAAALEETAWLAGQGPVPASLVREWLARGKGKTFYRRIFTNNAGDFTALDSKRRTFPTAIRQAILARDDKCRTPGCGAPIRQYDHILAVKDGGSTSWDNAQGLCVHCNQTKETPGWHTTIGDGALEITTPTGHGYTAPAPSKPHLKRRE